MFCVPNRIMTDNCTQFTTKTFMQYCQDIGTKVCFTFVAHPRSNGKVERANAKELRGLKTRTFVKLCKHGRHLIGELPAALLSIKMTPNQATGETPCALVYGMDAIPPMELTYGSPRVHAFYED